MRVAVPDLRAEQLWLLRRDLEQATLGVEEHRGLVAATDDHRPEIALCHPRLRELGGGLGALAGQHLGRVGLDEP
jgi:hypothetical protein